MSNLDYKYIELINLIKKIYHKEKQILLHRPIFNDKEKYNLEKCIDTNYVSSVGKEILNFESHLSKLTGAKYVTCVTNATSGLHLSLNLLGLNEDHEVLTQSYSFVATVNAILYCKSKPIFIDIEKDNLGMCPDKLENFLKKNTFYKNGKTFNKKTKKEIKCCIPTHNYGHPCLIREIKEVCDKYSILIVEDAAESLNSYYKRKHTGLFGNLGVISFNGNKIITTGGGGAIITNSKEKFLSLQHISKTAKIPKIYDFYHDRLGYNYRMPNLNASLGLAQLLKLDSFTKRKNNVYKQYQTFFEENDISYFKERKYSKWNKWLNCMILNNISEKKKFIDLWIKNNIQVRSGWSLLNNFKYLSKYQSDNLDNSKFFAERLITLPSSVPY